MVTNENKQLYTELQFKNEELMVARNCVKRNFHNSQMLYEYVQSKSINDDVGIPLKITMKRLTTISERIEAKNTEWRHSRFGRLSLIASNEKNIID